VDWSLHKSVSCPEPMSFQCIYMSELFYFIKSEMTFELLFFLFSAMQRNNVLTCLTKYQT